MSDIRDQIRAIIDTVDDGRKLVEELSKFGAKTLEEHADVWAPVAFKRLPEGKLRLFGLSLAGSTHATVIEKILVDLDPQRYRKAYHTLYSRVVNRERLNQDLMQLLKSGKSADEIMQQIAAMNDWNLKQTWGYWQQRKYFHLTDETARAIYRKLPRSLAHSLLMLGVRYAAGEDYGSLLSAIEASEKQSGFYWNIFQRAATPAQWHQTLRDFLKEQHKNDYSVSRTLYPRRPQQYIEFDIPEDITKQLLERYGSNIERFIQQTSVRYASKCVRDGLTSMDDDQLFRLLMDLAYVNRAALEATQADWATAVYERSPSRFENLLKHNLKDEAIIRQVLPLAQENGQLMLYQHLYAKIITAQEWLSAVQAVIDSAKSPGQMLSELDWLDVERHDLRLTDEMATQLYKKHPQMFSEFIRQHVRLQQLRGFEYPQLRATILAEDAEQWWAIFRQVTTADLWEKSLRDLLEADVPPHAIADELEKRHPATLKPPLKALQPVLEKYGSAMLPYLEKHVQLLTEDRLRQLLALDIDRADLRAELEKLSRVQAADFQKMVDIWLPAIYDPASDFWDKFILRNITWTARQHLTDRTILERMEADGKYNLFTTIYRFVTDTSAWQQDIRNLIQSDMPDEELLAALERRLRWQHFGDEIVAQLYTRNPQVFREYIIEHSPIRHTYYRKPADYTQLEAAARKAGDTQLVQMILSYKRGGAAWMVVMKEILDDRNITAEEALKRINDLNHIYGQELGDYLLRLFERFGEPMLDLLLKYRWQVRRASPDRLLKQLRALYDPDVDARYWQYFFQLSAATQWNKHLAITLKSNLDDAALAERIALMSPANYNIGGRNWQLSDENAYALMQRDAAQYYPLIRAYSQRYSAALFKLARQQQDVDLIDGMLYRLLVTQHRDAEIPQEPLDYLRALRDENPEAFIRHARNIFAHILPFEIWHYTRDAFLNNPIYTLLLDDPARWLQSPEAITDLLESPNIYVIYIGLEMIATEGQDAADRTAENLFWIRSFLLSQARRNTKMLALTALENAATFGYAQQVLDVLTVVKQYHGKRTIDEKALVAYGRIQHQMSMEGAS